MAKFKVGDVVSLKDGYSVPSGASGNRAVVVEVLRPAGGDFNYWLRFDGGREREQHGDHLVLANAVRNAVDEAGRPLRQENIQGFKDADGKLIKVGDMLEDTVGTTKGKRSKVVGFKGTQIYLDSGWKISKSNAALTRIVNSRAANADEWIGKTVEVKGVYWLTMGAVKAGTKFKVVEKNPNGGYDLKNLSGGAGMKGVFPKLMVVSNSLRSRNAVVQKALNARWRIIYRNLNGPFFPYGKETYSTREEAEKRAEELRKRGKKWGSDASYFVDEVGNSRAANAVVKRALNASRVARNADYDYDEDLGVKSIFKVGKVYRPTSGRRNWLYKVVKRNYLAIYVDPKAPGDKTFGEKYATEKLLIDSVKTLQRHAEIAGDRWGTLTLSAANVVG